MFILGVLGFLKTTRSFLKLPEEVRSLPKMSKVCQRRSFHLLFTSLYTWFSFLTCVSQVNIFLKIVSSKMATTHIFQSGVRNWPASVSRCEIEVFNPQAWDSRLRRETWQVYTGLPSSFLRTHPFLCMDLCIIMHIIEQSSQSYNIF